MECFSVAADGGGETEYYYTDIVRLLKVLCNCLEYLYNANEVEEIFLLVLDGEECAGIRICISMYN